MLLKLELRDGSALPDIQALHHGVELVSQEDKSVILAFATQEGLAEFEARLATLAVNGRPSRVEILFALQAFDHWTPDDRMGRALREQGFPTTEPFILDVELWPQERADRRDTMVSVFRAFLERHGIEFLDSLRQPSLVMLKVRGTREQAERLLLHYRDVRTVDLPSRGGIAVEIIRTDVEAIGEPPPPPVDAPTLGILDAGLTGAHPLLAGAVGDAQGYLSPHREVTDDAPRWHGTFVSGIALYKDVLDCLQQRQFVPQLRILSGKVFRDDGVDQVEFVETALEEAVRDLLQRFECRVFNFSFGDLNRVYDGRHVRGLAYTLDRLTRELGVLFVVPTGNLLVADMFDDAASTFPDYLFKPSSRLLDPAPALNALTVGGLAAHTATFQTQQRPETIEDVPVAQRDQPFPLTRTGPSIGGAIKPDVVEHAGNLAVLRGGGRARHHGLGIVSTSGGFATGSFLSQDIGTSYAAPAVAHRAALLLKDLPGASPNLIRALIGVHASWPRAAVDLLNPNDSSEGKATMLRAMGYGKIDDAGLYRSLDQTVTLLSEDSIENDKCHFYELPTSAEFWSPGSRTREISVALAHSPEVRTTRLDYRMTRLSYRFVIGSSLTEVEQAYRRHRERDQAIPEHDGGRRWLASTDRDRGTLQVSRWTFRRPIPTHKKAFVVVTRQDAAWSTVTHQPELYGLTVVISDRENVSINLYSEIQAQLQARIQERVRVRV